mmetsp:Transcript_624/g.1061  ORF Transcript_624/g.1061 Transcript_624/m.1061 type:complete len:126 (-) Transcript_624:2125-2502(-)
MGSSSGACQGEYILAYYRDTRRSAPFSAYAKLRGLELETVTRAISQPFTQAHPMRAICLQNKCKTNLQNKLISNDAKVDKLPTGQGKHRWPCLGWTLLLAACGIECGDLLGIRVSNSNLQQIFLQ